MHRLVYQRRVQAKNLLAERKVGVLEKLMVMSSVVKPFTVVVMAHAEKGHRPIMC